MTAASEAKMREIALKATESELATIGLRTDNGEAKERRKDFEFLRRFRIIAERAELVVVGTLVTAAIAGLLTILGRWLL